MKTPAPRQNLERECRHADLDAARWALVHLQAACEGVQEHVDTYFRCGEGRLKLRRIDGVHSELIWYDRPSDPGMRISRYYRVHVSEHDGMAAALTSALEIRAVIKKRREVWKWHNVRIHLDEVDGLGSFIEFEAVLDPDNDEAISLVRLETLGAGLALDATKDEAGSYADLLG